MLLTVVTCKEPSSPMIQVVDSPTYRNCYQHLCSICIGKVRVIPQNMEKYLSLTVGQLKFIGSFLFTPKGFDVLVETPVDDEFRYLRESCTSNHVGRIRRKGVYPCDYNG